MYPRKQIKPKKQNTFSCFLTSFLQRGVCSMVMEGNTIPTHGKFTDSRIQHVSEEKYTDRGNTSNKQPFGT